MINVHNLVKLDKYTNIIPLPKLFLMTRSFEMIGSISHYSNWRASLRGNELDEISFEVTKYVNGVLNPIWDDLVDLKIVSIQSGGKFEIQVTYTDETQTTKSVNGVSLETELGQVALYDFHVNDEFAIEAEDYQVTVLYNPNDTDHSLLHRVLKDKAPQWSIDDDRMTEYVVSDEEGEPELVSHFQREYTVDGTPIYDFLTSEVAEDANVVFRFDTDTRQLWCESLVNYVNDQSVEVVDAVGEDTTILVSKKKLGNSITINSNKDSVKNCFRVEGGDDLMTSQVAVVNMTGTNYIFHFADFQLNDMPVTLKNAILGYEEWLNSPEHQEEYYGENGLYTQYVEANDLLYYYNDSMAPSIHVDPPEDSEEQWTELKTKLEANDMYIGVSDLTSYDSQYYVGVTNNVKTMLEVWCDSRYKVGLVEDYTPTYNATTHTWTGVFRVTKVSDTNDHYPPVKDNPAQYEEYVFTAKIAEDSDTNLTYTRQRVEIALAKGDMTRVDAEFTDNTPYEDLVEYFEQWNLVKLKSFSDGYKTCQSVLMSGRTLKSGTEPEREIAEDLMSEYSRRLRAVDQVLEERQGQVNEQQKIINELIGYTDADGTENIGNIQKFQQRMSFMSYLLLSHTQEEAERLYTIYRSYIREDAYQNSNYVSDNLETQSDLTDNAKKLLHQAERELKNSCVLQRTMNVSLNNLLALPEFEPLYDKFELFNYIRVKTDDETLKLRLIGVDYSGDGMETIEVTFSDQIESVDGNISDLQSILDQAQSIATSYSSVQFKAEQGTKAKSYVDNIITNGLNAASTMLKNSEDNEVEISRAGILAKRMDDQGVYGRKQLRIIGNGMYMTETAWGEDPDPDRPNLPDVSMAVGEILFTDPISYTSSWKYGVIADAIVGNIIVGQNLYIGNSSGSVEITGDGIKITNGEITWGDGTNSVNSPTISDIPNLSTTLNTMADEIEQLDGRIQTYSQPNDPSTDWTTAEEKESHIGDIWYDTTNELTKRYSKNGNVYSWVEVHDSELETLAKSKATVFVSKPTNGYSAKDLWILESDSVHSPNKEGSILVATTTSTTYDATHWIEDVRYTDDSALTNFITNTYTPDKQNIQEQIDGKIETYYQSTKPHNEYTAIDDNTEYDKWLGDIWYDTTNDKSFIYYKETNGTKFNYVWKESDGVPDSVYDQIDGKNTIYVTYPVSPDVPESGDLLIPNSDITQSGVTYKAKKVYKYNGSAFVEIDYTDDTALTTFLTGQYVTDMTNIGTELDKRAETWYLTESAMNTETATWNTTTIKDKHIGDIWYCTGINSGTTAYIVGHTYMYGKINSTYSWHEVDGVPKTVFDTIDGKRSIFLSQPNTVRDDGYYYRQGDMWVLASDTTISGVTYPAQTILYASADNTTGFNPAQWGPATTKSAEDALDQIDTLNTDYSSFKTQVNNSLNTTVVGQDYIISPKIGGGYLYITNTAGTAYVEIDPKGAHDNNAYLIRAHYGNDDLFTINSSGQAFFSGAITVGDTPSFSTTGFTVNQNGLLQASNVTIYGSIYSGNGQIGGWDIDTHTIKVYKDSTQNYKVTQLILSDSGSITSQFIEGDPRMPYSISTVLRQGYLYMAFNDNGSIYPSQIQKNKTSMTFIQDPNNEDCSFRFTFNEGNEEVDAFSIFRDATDPEDPYYLAIISADLSVTGQNSYFRSITASEESVINSLSVTNTLTARNVEATNSIKYVTTVYSDNWQSAPSDADKYACGNRYITTPSTASYTFTPLYINQSTSYLDLGSPYTKWKNIYAVNGTIQTSDRNYKNSIQSINNSYEEMFMQLEPVSYKMNEGKRTHIGFISQDVEEAMSKSNLTDNDFAGFCKDIKMEFEYDDDGNISGQKEIKDKKGNPEYSYSLRYDEFIALNTHMIQKLYKRVEELETELKELKNRA